MRVFMNKHKGKYAECKPAPCEARVEIIKSLPFLDYFFSFTVTRHSRVKSSSWLPTGDCNSEKTKWFSMD